jgi:hypothetical protein
LGRTTVNHPLFGGIQIAELKAVGLNPEAKQLLVEADELRIRASQLTSTANQLINQAEELNARAAVLLERAQRLGGEEEGISPKR